MTSGDLVKHWLPRLKGDLRVAGAWDFHGTDMMQTFVDAVGDSRPKLLQDVLGAMPTQTAYIALATAVGPSTGVASTAATPSSPTHHARPRHGLRRCAKRRCSLCVRVHTSTPMLH